MYKVGIIGSENSHAMAFSRYFNKSGRCDDIRVTAIWGEDRAASEEVSLECGVSIMTPEDMLSQVDAVMVTARDGALHAGYALPFIRAGKPAFIDKPLTIDPAEAEAVIAEAAQRGVPVMGGSSVKLAIGTVAAKAYADAAKERGELAGGCVHAPVTMENPYGGFYFYASHLVEVALTIFGYDPVAVTAVRTKANVTAILEYRDIGISLNFTDGVYKYGATVLWKDGADRREITLDDCYEREAHLFAEMLRTGRTPQTAHEMIMPVKVLKAIEQSYTTGQRTVIE